jgi:hypothetical protein
MTDVTEKVPTTAADQPGGDQPGGDEPRDQAVARPRKGAGRGA